MRPGEREAFGLRCFSTAFSPRRSSVHRPGRRGQDQLIEGQIEPASELEAGLPDRAAVRESETLVQSDARCVRGIDAADQNVVILSLRRLNDFLEQTFPDS